MKNLTLLNNYRTIKRRVPRKSVTNFSPMSLLLGSALFLGATQLAVAATTFTLVISPPGPIGAAINTNIPYSITLLETGSTASTGTTTVKSTLPTGMTFVSGGAATSGFSCTYASTSRLVTCNRTTSIARNVPVVIPLTLKATTTGTRSVTASVSGGGSWNTVTSNAVSTVVSTVAPPAFTVSLVGPASTVVGSPFSYTATVNNTSVTPTTGTTVLSTTLPSGLAFVSGNSPGGFTCSAALQVVTCNRTTVMSQNVADTVTLAVSSTTSGAKATSVSVSGGGAVGSVTSNTVTTTVATAPDLAVRVRQPTPALAAPAMSQVEVRVTNNGGTVAAAPIKVTFTLPANVSAPLKFSRIADHWVCVTNAQVVNCTLDQAINAGANSRLRIPVTPAAATVGTIPSPFVASVAAVAGETNLANNGPINMTPTTAVIAWVGTGIVDPTGTYSNLVLSPTTIPKYVLPLPNPNAAFFKHIPDTTTFPGSDFYTLDVKQVKAQILPPGFPATNVFAYGDPARPDSFTYPAHTIESRSTDVANTSGLGKSVKIQYKNSGLAAVTKHLLPVDHSIHGANAGEPDIRTIAHLHGSRVINQTSDGYSEAWSAPNGVAGAPMTTSTSLFNSEPFDYSNQQDATMMWYHDHTLGMTRLNVYAGLAGLYLLRDDNEMAMLSTNQLPSGPYEVPLVLQDRMFNVDGSLAYPDKVVGANGATIGSLTAPSMVPEFFGDVMVVNGAAWPYLQVEPRKYRFRILNGSNARFYTLGLSARSQNGTVTAVPFQVIGAEGGFLNAPTTVNSLTMGPAERYDVIVDFSTLNARNVTLTNSARAPFGRTVACPATSPTCVPPGALPTAGLHDQLMQFRVNLPISTVPVATIPTLLRPVAVPAAVPAATVRQVMLAETVDNLARVLPVLGTPDFGIRAWMDQPTETPAPGSEETWEIYNTSMDAHPVHLHSSAFQVINRQAFTATLGSSGKLMPGTVVLGAIKALPSTETGWKETVIAYPSEQNNIPISVGQTVSGEITRVRVKFDTPPPQIPGGAAGGQFVWHCHIVEHEDHDMMRPLVIQ